MAKYMVKDSVEINASATALDNAAGHNREHPSTVDDKDVAAQSQPGPLLDALKSTLLLVQSCYIIRAKMPFLVNCFMLFLKGTTLLSK